MLRKVDSPEIRDTLRGTVEFRNVSKRYGVVAAVEDVSLHINPGELVCLLGPSGCGKTTTLRLIAGLEAATAGKIEIGGRNVTHLSATYRNVAMVFQSYALFPHMSVKENIGYGLRVSKVPPKILSEKVEVGLEMVGLAGYGDRYPNELSGGQQQRVAVARAVVLEPEVLLFDEPLSNLDAKLRRHVRQEIRQIQQNTGLTAVYVTHDQEEAMAVADRIIVMDRGKIAQQGSPKQLYEQPASRFIADFIGDANVLPCRLENIDGQNATIEFCGQGKRVRVHRKEFAKPALVLRPQDVAVLRDGGDGRIPGEITSATYLGNQIQYSVMTEAGEIFVIDTAMKDMFECEEPVYLELNEDKLVLVEDE